MFAAARDITEQKKLEQQLRESQSYNRGLIEASVDGLITVDPSGSISDVNEQMCRMSGYSREELTGTPFSDYFRMRSGPTAGVKETLRRAWSPTTSHSGAPRRAAVAGFVQRLGIQGPSGRACAASSPRPATSPSRRACSRNLREERTYNRGLIEASLDGLITVDPMLSHH